MSANLKIILVLSFNPKLKIVYCFLISLTAISKWAKLFSVGVIFPVYSFLLSKDFAWKQEDKVFSLTEQNRCRNFCKILFYASDPGKIKEMIVCLWSSCSRKESCCGKRIDFFSTSVVWEQVITPAFPSARKIMHNY